MTPTRTPIPIIVAALTLGVLAAPPATAAETGQGDPAAGRSLAKEFGCNGCHALTTGPGVRIPFIAGQKKAYLTRQMRAFRETRAKVPGPYKVIERDHPVMSSEARPLADAEVGHLAEYFAGLPCVPKRAFAETQVPRPPLVERCQFCHGETGVTPYVSYPNIGGQKKAYLMRQLRAFRASSTHLNAPVSKTKDERFHRMMGPGVYDLADADIEAVAEYYSRQSCR